MIFAQLQCIFVLGALVSGVLSAPSGIAAADQLAVKIHGIDEVADFTLQSLKNEYDAPSLEIIKISQASVHLATETLFYDVMLELTIEKNTTIICSGTVIKQLLENNMIVENTDCVIPSSNGKNVQYEKRKMVKPTAGVSVSKSLCKIGDKCSTSSNTFEGVASFATNAINQQALFEVRPYKLVEVVEASVNYYWQATLHYELQMNLIAEKELALCTATVIDQMGSKSPHLIKSKCMSIPPTNRSIDSLIITPSTNSTSVIAIPTEPMPVTTETSRIATTSMTYPVTTITTQPTTRAPAITTKAAPLIELIVNNSSSTRESS